MVEYIDISTPQALKNKNAYVKALIEQYPDEPVFSINTTYTIEIENEGETQAVEITLSNLIQKITSLNDKIHFCVGEFIEEHLLSILAFKPGSELTQEALRELSLFDIMLRRPVKPIPVKVLYSFKESNKASKDWHIMGNENPTIKFQKLSINSFLPIKKEYANLLYLQNECEENVDVLLPKKIKPLQACQLTFSHNGEKKELAYQVLTTEFYDGLDGCLLAKNNIKLDNKEKIIGFIDAFLSICNQVKCLCDRNLLHKDIKLDNIIFTTDEEMSVITSARLVDWESMGAPWKRMASSNPIRDKIQGTPAYLSLDLLNNGNTQETDIFALGLTFYELLKAMLSHKIQIEIGDNDNNPCVYNKSSNGWNVNFFNEINAYKKEMSEKEGELLCGKLIKDFFGLLKSMMSEEPSQRPSIEHCLKRAESIKTSLNNQAIFRATFSLSKSI